MELGVEARVGAARKASGGASGAAARAEAGGRGASPAPVRPWGESRRPAWEGAPAFRARPGACGRAPGLAEVASGGRSGQRPGRPAGGELPPAVPVGDKSGGDPTRAAALGRRRPSEGMAPSASPGPGDLLRPRSLAADHTRRATGRSSATPHRKCPGGFAQPLLGGRCSRPKTIRAAAPRLRTANAGSPPHGNSGAPCRLCIAGSPVKTGRPASGPRFSRRVKRRGLP